jgi:hypothetical protein
VTSFQHEERKDFDKEEEEEEVVDNDEEVKLEIPPHSPHLTENLETEEDHGILAKKVSQPNYINNHKF